MSLKVTAEAAVEANRADSTEINSVNASWLGGSRA